MENNAKVDNEVFVFPISPNHKRFWFHEKNNPNSNTYIIPLVLTFDGNLNCHAFESSLKEIINRHESLRTFFKEVDGEPVQVINPTSSFSLQIIDHMKESNIELEDLIKYEVSKTINIEKAPLFRSLLIRKSANEYIFIWCMHHLISDGWSLNNFLNELSINYNSLLEGRPSPFSELEIQYVDFSEWYREWLEGDEANEHLRYWMNKLSGELPIVNLPIDYSRPIMQTFNGDNVTFELPKEIEMGLQKLSREQNASLFITLTAAFKVLLSRYTGQDDLIVGMPVAGRNVSEVEKLIGFFVNTLVIRNHLSLNNSFYEFLSQVRDSILGALDHQEIPFEDLVEKLRPVRDPSYPTLVQVMVDFNELNTMENKAKFNGLNWNNITMDDNTAKFDLTFSMKRENNRMYFTLNYNKDLFMKETIYRMGQNFTALLKGIVLNPNEKIGVLPILSEQEKKQVLLDWNKTEVDISVYNIPHYFEKQVLNNPQKIAVVFEGKQLTYEELNNSANKLAHYLRNQGISVGDHVGICIGRSIDLIIAVIGVIKAGAAYVPIDTELPEERKKFIIADSEIKILLTSEKFRIKTSDNQVNIVYIDNDWEITSKERYGNPVHAIPSDTAAYVIYTSGSTGLPKGVSVGHNGLVNLISDYQNIRAISVGERCSFWASFSFDASIYEIFTALLSGGELHIIPDSIRLDCEKSVKWFFENEIVNLFVPPFMLSEFLKWIKRKPLNTYSLNRLMVGVEPIPEQTLAEINQYVPNLQIINSYGPTETTIISVRHSFKNKEKITEKNVPIGRPVQNNKVYVLDSQQNPVPIGVTGELYIGGIGVSKGYINRPELNEKYFVNNPYSCNSNERLYRTGDLVRYLCDGNLEYVGRSDEQVKIRGLRIELGEIQSILESHPLVENAVVLKTDEQSVATLTAYYVSVSNLETDSLRNFLKEKLPTFMIPAIYIKLNQIPLTPNGKVDKYKLPQPTLLDKKNKYVAPRNIIEEQISDIWAEILKEDGIGIYDDFFSLGGHSLLATKIIGRINQTFNTNFPINTLFKESSIADFAKLLSNNS